MRSSRSRARLASDLDFDEFVAAVPTGRRCLLAGWPKYVGSGRRCRFRQRIARDLAAGTDECRRNRPVPTCDRPDPVDAIRIVDAATSVAGFAVASPTHRGHVATHPGPAQAVRGIAAYRLRMVAGPTLVDVLLRELESGVVVPDRYSRRSVYGRCEPLMMTALLALIAIVAGMLLGGLSETDDEA